MLTWWVATIETIKEKSGKADVICTVHYDCVDKKRIGNWEPEGMVSGVLELNTDDLSDFTEYSALSEVDVIGWIKRDLGDTKVAEIEAQATAKLDARMNPPTTIVSTFPWNA